MRTYNAKVQHQKNGTKYYRTVTVAVKASNVTGAASKAVRVAKTQATGWREPVGATFHLEIERTS